ncbi:hypothetical protein D1Z37_14015 [Enterococcus faecium]|nr:hypothetical protein [Enterococcus faecium]
MCCGNSILQKGLPFFYLHKIFYTLLSIATAFVCVPPTSIPIRTNRFIRHSSISFLLSQSVRSYHTIRT